MGDVIYSLWINYIHTTDLCRQKKNDESGEKINIQVHFLRPKSMHKQDIELKEADNKETILMKDNYWWRRHGTR